MRRSSGLIALDAVAVLAFAAIGRASHDEADDAVLGVLTTAAPFLVGALVGALVARSWRAPTAWRSGILTWLGAAGVGLALRFALYDRLPVTFVLVTVVSLGVLVLGWRAVATIVVRAGGRRRTGVRA